MSEKEIKKAVKLVQGKVQKKQPKKAEVPAQPVAPEAEEPAPEEQPVENLEEAVEKPADPIIQPEQENPAEPYQENTSYKQEKYETPTAKDLIEEEQPKLIDDAPNAVEQQQEKMLAYNMQLQGKIQGTETIDRKEKRKLLGK